MAIVVESVSSTNNWATSTTTIVITKPTGLAVGDYMIASVGTSSGVTAAVGISSPGFTTIVASGGSSGGGSFNGSIYMLYKVATSGDVAATNFTFTASSAARMSGGILRLSGVSGIGNSASNTINDASNPSYTGLPVTPTLASSLLVFATAVFNANAAASVSGYSIATSNPTWAEQWDLPGSGVSVGTSIATATRSQITSTGIATCTFSVGDNSEDSMALMVVINPIQDATVPADAVSAVVTTQTPSIQVGVVMTPAAISINLNVQSPVVAMIREWNKETKGTTPWTNDQK